MDVNMKLPNAGLAAVLALAASSAPAGAGEGSPGWSDTAEFSYVVTDGNSETSTLGFKNKLLRSWEGSAIELNAGGIRAEATTTDRLFAVGTVNNFSVTEESTTEATAENYYLNGRYDWKLSEHAFWFAGAGWDRNEFAGIANRYTGFGGFGNTWADRDDLKFRTDYGLTYTKQNDVVENPEVDDTFMGFRFSWSYLHRFADATTYGNDLVLDENLEEKDDFRADMTNWVTVAMSERLALKVSLQWLFDNSPSIELIDLFATAPPPGASSPVKVPRELDDLDTIFTTSLVITF